MKLHYITSARLPTERAHGTQIVKMCDAFSVAGIETVLYSPNKKKEGEERDIFSYYNVPSLFESKRLWSTDFLGKTLRFGRIFYWLDTITFFISLYFNKEIKSADIIYTRDPLLLKAFSKKKYILCAEIHDIPEKKKTFIKNLSRADKIIALNNIVKSELIELGIEKEKIDFAMDGVDIKEFDIPISKSEAREKVGLPQDAFISLYTGHLYGWKGANVFAAAAKDLPLSHVCVFVGGLDKEYQDFLNDTKDIPNIRVFPFQSREKIPVYLKAADILVIPNSASNSNSIKYTSPLKLFEYMAAKRPIVASDLPSMRQVLDENNCVFARADNPSSFADAITKLSENNGKMQDIAERAFENVKNYTWIARGKKIIDFIKK